jgi:hypothetical protein
MKRRQFITLLGGALQTILASPQNSLCEATDPILRILRPTPQLCRHAVLGGERLDPQEFG